MNLYLQFNFSTLSSEKRKTDETVEMSLPKGHSAADSGLRTKLEQSLHCVADNLLNCYSPDVSGSSECAFIIITMTKCFVF